MASDPITFLLGFTFVFGGLALYLAHLERRARRLEDRLAALEARAPQDPTAGTEGGR